MKRFAIDSVDAVQAAELQMPGALGARDGHFEMGTSGGHL